MDRYFFILCLLGITVLVKARQGRILGGNYAAEGQFPYQVSVQANLKNRGYKPVCGGGIIGERFVLTAAHCVINEQRVFRSMYYEVAIGATDLSRPGTYRTISVRKFHVPISFDSTKTTNDIAILELSQNIGLNNSLRKLDLPSRNENYADHVAQIAGWGWNWIQVHTVPEKGKKLEGTGGSDKKLRYLNVRVISNDECRQQHVTSAIIKSNICGQALRRNVYGQAKGICSGDSGGPLVIGNTVIGVARGSAAGCRENERAAVYTRVSSYLKTINNVINGRKTKNMYVLDVNNYYRTSRAV